VAKELLGKYLVREIGRRVIKGKITEVEAYIGTKDLASHASKGRTKRTETMFGPPGHAYIYMIYGMYYCLNIVTEKKEFPAAVLIRGIEINQISLASRLAKAPAKRAPRLGRGRANLKSPSFSPRRSSGEAGAEAPAGGQNFRKLDGPGKVCREFEIDKTFNGEDIINSNKLWIEGGEEANLHKIIKSKRIGIDYAGGWRDKLWRFYID